MHPFSQDANIALTHAQQREHNHRSGPRRGTLSTSLLAAGSGSATAGAAAQSVNGSTSNRLPTYIDYSKPGSAASSTVRDILSIDGNDDKYRKGGWRNRLIARANRAQGVLGALQRSSIRAGVLEQKFWWRLLVLFIILLLATVSAAPVQPSPHASACNPGTGVTCERLTVSNPHALSSAYSSDLTRHILRSRSTQETGSTVSSSQSLRCPERASPRRACRQATTPLHQSHLRARPYKHTRSSSTQASTCASVWTATTSAGSSPRRL